MKKGFTIVEVSILFVIFLIVAFLVAPLSLDDNLQAKNTSRWRTVQEDFSNIFYAINTRKDENNITFEAALDETISNEFKADSMSYKITFMNGTYPSKTYRFNNLKTTYSNATVAYNLFKEPQNGKQGVLMYDVNGTTGPNTWGKDVFGYNIYQDRFEPFCKSEPISTQKQDCSRNGTGLCCSNYYLIGGSFD
jgi:type II secretory pathway pseudopilin PulG